MPSLADGSYRKTSSHVGAGALSKEVDAVGWRALLLFSCFHCSEVPAVGFGFAANVGEKSWIYDEGDRVGIVG